MRTLDRFLRQSLSILILLLISQGALCAATSLSLTGPATARPGATVTLTLAIAGSTGEAYQWQITPPGSGLTLTTAIAPGVSTANKTLICSTDGTICILFSSSAPGATSTIPDGNLATVTLKIPAGTAPGSITLPLSNMIGAAGVPAQPLPVTSGGVYSLKILDPRDVNGDGVIDLSDVTAITTQITTASCTTGDVNGDGKCDVVDVLGVVLKILGLVP